MRGALAKVPQFLGNALLRPVSARMRRHDDRWLFGHQHGEFAGNSKFLYLWLLAHRPDLKPQWITPSAEVERRMRSHGLPVCRSGSPAGIRACLSAGVYLYCHGPEDVSVAFGGGALHVNLWHGVGLKAIQFGVPESNASKYSDPETGWAKRLYGLGSRIDPDLLISTSVFTSLHFARQFRIPASRCPPCGYPRLDVASDAKLAALVREIEGDVGSALRDGAREIYVYAPTFRDSGRDFLAEAFPDRPELERALEGRNALLYVKLHPHTPVPSNWGSDRIRLWPEQTDLYSCLDSVDGLLTDYSSLHYDWLFHSDCGAALYTFDADEFVNRDRTLLYPFDENVAGWKANNFAELVELVVSGRALRQHPGALQVRRRFWKNLDGPASPRVVEAIEQRLALTSRSERLRVDRISNKSEKVID